MVLHGPSKRSVRLKKRILRLAYETVRPEAGFLKGPTLAKFTWAK